MSARTKVLGRRPRYADVAATLALVFAMGGTAYAVTSLPPGSVDTAAMQAIAVTAPKLAVEAVSTENIVPEAVTHGKLAMNAVTGGDVQNHSLTVSDLAGANVTGPTNFTLFAHRCSYLTFIVPGARVGQLALFSWVGTTSPSQGV